MDKEVIHDIRELGGRFTMRMDALIGQVEAITVQYAAVNRRCTRCGEARPCSTWHTVPICDGCVSLIVAEWAIKREEVSELVRS